ncbi:MAG TPA: biotin/lipoate A/B protein ligase family protein, partial [Rhodanobacteraceae bacterium]|nr:biotin/lipoate A/B protein ligase family protein [Rhodanobacteraceae bacterium]
ARRHGIEVVRRISGGGAMFIEPGNTITYSLYAPETLIAGMGFQESYEFMDAWVIDALQGLGIHAWYQPLNDITSPAGKIAGAAQTRRGGAVLHHVTMAYDIDTAKMLDVLRIGREKLSDKATQSAAKRVDPLRSQTGLARAEVIDKMIATFRRRYGLATGRLHPHELERAGTLAESKFSSAAWTGIVP